MYYSPLIYNACFGTSRVEGFLSFAGPRSRPFAEAADLHPAQLRLDKRDRPSRLRPRIARSGEGDARAKAGGARDNHCGEWGGFALHRPRSQRLLRRSRRLARVFVTRGRSGLEALLTVPFPLISLWGTGTALHRRSSQALPTSGRAAKPAGSLQRLQHGAQPLVLDPE